MATRAVILDVDGTLMDTNYLHTEAWARAFEKVGQRVPRAALHKQIGKGAGLLVPEFVEGEEAQEEAEEAHGEIYGELQEYGYPLPGAKELIDSLVEKGYEVWLVTSAQPGELDESLEQLEAGDKLTGIVQSSDVENPKPAPDIFEHALEEAGVGADEVVAVGDSVWDVEAAAGAGVKIVGVLSGGAYSARELEEAGAVAVYDNCAELLEAGFPESY